MGQTDWDNQILDKVNCFVYVSDIDTYDLLYLNRYGREKVNLPQTGKLCGKCYEILQNRDKPCEFCNGEALLHDKSCIWTHRNDVLQRDYLLQDVMMERDNRRLRLEIATDMTEMEADAEQTRAYLAMERNLVHCIRELTATDNIEDAINRVMRSILDYYEGDRAYIFEFDWDANVTHNTYEQCAQGITAEIDNLRNVPIEAVGVWIKMFGKQSYVYIEDLEALLDDPDRREEYDTLKPQGINSLLTVPFYYDNELRGFLGVDNPKLNCKDFSFLQTLTYFINNEMEKHRMHNRLQRMSYIDLLTGVFNRNRYSERVESFVKNPPKSAGVVFIDMNGLKYINDTIGHNYGDDAIRRLIRILRCFFPERVLFRISGDEFVVLWENCEEESFEKTISALMEQCSDNGEDIASVGYLWDNSNVDIKQMVISAEQMMYVNKQNYYAKHPENRSKHRPAILNALLKDLEKEKYCVYLQPKSVVADGRIYGAEALVRMIDNDGRIVLPYEFIALMESEGVISKIDFFVLETVCKTIQRWRHDNRREMYVSVNMSRVTIAENDFVHHVVETCDKYEIPHHLIELEITESTKTIDARRMKEIAASLKKEGVALSLDDMGMDYSSLRLIPMEGVEVVKLDRSFITMMEQGDNDRILVEHIIKLCHAMDRTCVAEGVESERQLAMLKAMDCDFLQGYLLDRPLPIEQFEEKYLGCGIAAATFGV